MLTRRVCSAVMSDVQFSCTRDASASLTCTGELLLLLGDAVPCPRTTKRRRRLLAVDAFVDELMCAVVANDRVTMRFCALPERERIAALYALRLLRDKFVSGALDQLLTNAHNCDVGAVESALIAALLSSSPVTSRVAEPTTLGVASDADVDVWLSGADLSALECVESRAVDDDADDDRSAATTQFARDNVYELNKAMAADDLTERLEPIRRQLAALVSGGAAALAAFDWLPLLRVVESGANVEQVATVVGSQLRLCPVEACAALLAAVCQSSDELSFSLASKSAFLELVVAARLCELERVAPRVLVTALQQALQSVHGLACAASLLAPVLARGGSAQAELVARVLKEDTTSAEVCNEFLERVLARDDVAWSDFAFAALQGVLDKKAFQLSSAAAIAFCHMLVSQAAAHRASLKFATLLFRLVSKHGTDVPPQKLGDLTLVANRCDNFMGKAAGSTLATLRATCGEAAQR